MCFLKFLEVWIKIFKIFGSSGPIKEVLGLLLKVLELLI